MSYMLQFFQKYIICLKNKRKIFSINNNVLN